MSHTQEVAKQWWPDVLRQKARKDGIESGVALGARLGVSQSTASRWLSASGFPEGANLSKVADYLGMKEGPLAQLVFEAKRRREQAQARIETGESVKVPPMTREVLDELVERMAEDLSSSNPKRVASARRILRALADGLEDSETALAQELRRRAG